MSLKAAEKARRASEEFVQRVNDLSPDNPKKYHKDLVMGIDDKLSLLKKNVVRFSFSLLILQWVNILAKIIYFLSDFLQSFHVFTVFRECLLLKHLSVIPNAAVEMRNINRFGF